MALKVFRLFSLGIPLQKKNQFMKEILVILGNGFDLALGMKTSYRNFYEQKEFWPFGKKENDTNIRIRHMTGLDSFLDKNMQENWYNLENLLADYATGIKMLLQNK